MGVFNRVVLCLVLLVPLIFLGTAAAQTTYTATPISAGTISGGVSNVRFEVLPSGGGGTRYGNALVPVSKSSLGKMTVGAMARHPGIHLAIMAYLALHENWEWDALEHRFRTPEEELEAPSPEPQCPPGGVPQCSETPCYTELTYPTNFYEIVDWPPHDDIVRVCSSTGSSGTGVKVTYLTGASTMTGGELVPHTDVAERVQEASETITNQITNNVINQNNTTIQNEWNELHLTRVNIETSFANETPDGQWTQTPGAGDTTINNTFSMDFPIFCDWAGVVCSFIDWFQETNEPPEDPDLPTEETAEVWDEWDSGMPSSGSCPAPHTTEFMGNAISIPFDDFCYGLSTYFRPIFIALALFAAGFILVGARQ